MFPFRRHPETNIDLGKPAGWDDQVNGECVTLPAVQAVTTDGLHVYHTFYDPTPEQLARLNAGQPVRLSIYSRSHPVISIDARDDTGDHAIE